MNTIQHLNSGSSQKQSHLKLLLQIIDHALEKFLSNSFFDILRGQNIEVDHQANIVCLLNVVQTKTNGIKDWKTIH